MQQRGQRDGGEWRGSGKDEAHKGRTAAAPLKKSAFRPISIQD
jgi:hypothetical protein